MSLVIDCSVVLAWSLADENEDSATEALRRTIESGAIVPQIWWYELRNALLMNEHRGRIAPQQLANMLADLMALGIKMDSEHDEAGIFAFARRHSLTVYDANYLEVAFRRGLPLATLDRRLAAAAAAEGVAVI
ncbi:MAG: type II toxin-antitoxin system VapC family toxin [Alphaproteobacteria bacterium]|nr:type II toxin-antitoxin system VapC family toxin [Alphaproteobacteria bacterium]